MQLEFKGVSKYWLFQLLGWGLFIGINIFFAITYNLNDAQFLSRLAIYVGVGLLFSHIMRLSIKRIDLLTRPINYQLIGFVLLSILFGVIIGIIETYLSDFLNLEYKEEKVLNKGQKISSNIFTSFTYLFIWNCIYFIYHYIDQTRKTQLDKLKLEALVKTLELKTIKSHINPHFIFNALNSIRALVDEDPERARKAILELSNILRSSIQVDKVEITSLKKEMAIVKDYLALEYIRFADRLKIEYDIEDTTLDYAIPPMMLQTLVENAIKHGLSKQPGDCLIKIIAKIEGGKLNLMVQNTGILQTTENDGFGLQSTRDRLNILYSGEAEFNIYQCTPNQVTAKLIIPIQH